MFDDVTTRLRVCCECVSREIGISRPSVVRALQGRCIWPGKERRFKRGDLRCCLG